MTYEEAAQELTRMKDYTPQVLTEAHRALDMGIAALHDKHDAEQAAIAEDYGQTAPKSWSP